MSFTFSPILNKRFVHLNGVEILQFFIPNDGVIGAYFSTTNRFQLSDFLYFGRKKHVLMLFLEDNVKY